MLFNSKYWLLGGSLGVIITLMIVFGLVSLRKANTLAKLTGKLYRHPLTVSIAVLEYGGLKVDQAPRDHREGNP